MFSGVIARRVAAVLKQRVKDAEVEYNNQCLAIDTDCDQKINEVEENRIDYKANAADELVAKIIG